MDDNEQFDAVDDIQSDRFVDHSAQKFRIVVLLLAYSGVLGIMVCFLPEEAGPLDLIAGFPLLVLGISWCYTDAAERDHRLGRCTRLLLILLFIVGLPVYLFQSRGIRAIKTLAHLIVLVGTMFACEFVAEVISLYVGDVAGLWEMAY